MRFLVFFVEWKELVWFLALGDVFSGRDAELRFEEFAEGIYISKT